MHALGSLPLPEATQNSIPLPPRLKAPYTSLAVTGPTATVKLLSIPGRFDGSAEDRLVQSLGLHDPSEYRISYKVITEGHGRSESRVLAAALPNAEAEEALSLFPYGLPAPFSLELAGLADMSAFLAGPGAKHTSEAVGALHFGLNTTTFCLFCNAQPALIRRFDFGTASILERVQHRLGVDMETAEGILCDGSFDISQVISEVMAPVIKQLVVSRGFVERRENCSVAALYAGGALVQSRDALREIREAMDMDVQGWDPLDYVNPTKDAVPDELADQGWRFSAAIGAAIASLETS